MERVIQIQMGKEQGKDLSGRIGLEMTLWIQEGKAQRREMLIRMQIGKPQGKLRAGRPMRTAAREKPAGRTGNRKVLFWRLWSMAVPLP